MARYDEDFQELVRFYAVRDTAFAQNFSQYWSEKIGWTNLDKATLYNTMYAADKTSRNTGGYATVIWADKIGDR